MEFGNPLKGLKYVLKKSPKWVKIIWSILMGLAFCTICRDFDCFLDTMVMVTCYVAWMSIVLPYLYRRLTFKFICDTLFLIINLFIADFLVFVVHKALRRHFTGEEPVYDSQYHRGFVFSMNTLRVGAIVYCIGRSIPSFMKQVRIKYALSKRKKR